MSDQLYMDMALSLAQTAADLGETPVGCVIIDDATVTVRYTLTTMACGLGPLIESGIKEVAGSLPFDGVETELVFQPPWSPERISAEGKAFLGI